MDFNPTPFQIQYGFINWLIVMGILMLATLGVAWLMARARDSSVSVFGGLIGILKDALSVSPGRLMAISTLTIREAIRRRALLIFVVFIVVLMFGSWFMPQDTSKSSFDVQRPISFVRTLMTWSIVPAIMFLSCWGIPEDIRVRSLHTVVTKPIRRIEVVLGRMMGFSSVALLSLAVMAIGGGIWIYRQVPDSDMDKLTCRVPVYGEFYFLDRQGLPTSVGINVGDAWEYRSHIEGNTASRAVWTFPDVTPDRIGDGLQLESRFEAFRTIKGSDDTIQEGLEARYTLVNDSREVAFSYICVTPSFRDFGQQLRDGQFQNASITLKDAASRMRSTRNDFPVGDCKIASGAFDHASNVIQRTQPELQNIASGFQLLAQRAAAIDDPDDEVAYESMSEAAADLAETLSDNASTMTQNLARLEVPLEPFRVLEYHGGENANTYPHDVTFAADEESLARHLAATITLLNDQSVLAQDGNLADDAADSIANGHQIEQLNAELLVDVLSAEIDSGTVSIDGNKLAVADGSLWVQFFETIVRQGRLPSQYPEGWELTVNLFDDLAPDGQLRVEVSCLNDQMFVGMARPDMFVRLPDKPFYVGYAKAVLNIALMLMLVVILAVTASCVVKGPVSFFLSGSIFIIGQTSIFGDLLQAITVHKEKGTGLVESGMLIFQHRSPSVGIDANEGTQNLVEFIDTGIRAFVSVISWIIPDYSTFTGAFAYVEQGFDVPWSSSGLPALATFFGFLIPCVLIGTTCLKYRELESK